MALAVDGFEHLAVFNADHFLNGHVAVKALRDNFDLLVFSQRVLLRNSVNLLIAHGLVVAQ